MILPTKPRTPRHKGKVERGIDYVQSNALKGQTFGSLAEQNQHLLDWERRIADTRIHGTTRKQVQALFQEEKPHLTSLPAGRFPSFEEGRRSVHRDGHIEVARAYYSVPPEYTGREVWVRWDGHLVRIFNSKMESIAVHVQVEPGTFQTQDRHLHDKKISQVEKGTVWLLRRSALIAHDEFMELVLQDELLVRQDRQRQRRLKAAQFRELKTLEDFDWQFNPSIKKKLIYDLAGGRFIREARDCLWLGPPGTGKSHLCQAIGYQVIKMGFLVLYRSIFDVVRDFLEDEAFAGENKMLAKYLKPDLLIIDDMEIKQLPKRSGEYLFEIILRRYETKLVKSAQ